MAETQTQETTTPGQETPQLQILQDPLPTNPTPDQDQKATPEEEEAPATEDAELEICQICAEVIHPPSAYPFKNLTRDCERYSCQHGCLECLVHTLEYRLQVQEWHHLSCPTCETPIPDITVREHVSVDVWEK